MVYSVKFKLKVLNHVRLGITPMGAIAKIRKVPKQTIYRWYNTALRFGEARLVNRKPGAKENHINETFESCVLSTWNKRNVGVHKIWLALSKLGFTVSERQIQKVYIKHALKMNKRARPSQLKFVKYEWPKPNMLWHTDWTECPFTKKQLIAFIDDNSRFVVHAEYFENATTENTLLAFKNAIMRCGKPEAILTDNGVQFTPTRSEKGPFTQWCDEQGIKHILGRVHHPQTNGKIERWFGTYKQEFREGEDTLQSFVDYYNLDRLHQGIGYKVPQSRYRVTLM